MRGLTGRPKVHPIKDSNRKLLLTRQFFTIAPTSRSDTFELRFGSARKPGGVILFPRTAVLRRAASCGFTGHSVPLSQKVQATAHGHRLRRVGSFLILL